MDRRSFIGAGGTLALAGTPLVYGEGEWEIGGGNVDAGVGCNVWAGGWVWYGACTSGGSEYRINVEQTPGAQGVQGFLIFLNVC